jgi:rhomboid protease GluP
MMCGAPVVREPAAGARRGPRGVRRDREALGFVRAVVSRPAVFTFVFLTACVFLYLLMEFSGGAFGMVLWEYGAKVNRMIDERGEWWRFVTPLFLHVTIPGLGPLHLLVNMYGLFMLGPFVEKLYGSAKFVFFWIVTGVAGVAASYLTVRPGLAQGAWAYLFKAQDAPGAGASTALFGLVGVLFVFGIKYRKELPAEFKRAFGFGMLPMIVLNVVMGYVAGEQLGVDNAAHLGGLVAGVVLALFVSYKRPGEPPRRALPWRVVQVALLALVAASFTMAWRNFGGPQPDASRFRVGGLFGSAEVSRRVAAVNTAVNESGHAFNAALGGDAEQAELLIKRLDEAPELGEREKELRGQLKAILNSAQQYGAADPARRDRAQGEQLVKAYEHWRGRYLEWVREEGRHYQVELGEEAPPPSPEGEKKQ